MKPHTNRDLFNVLADSWKMDEPIRVKVKTVTSMAPITCSGQIKIIDGLPTIVIDLDQPQPRIEP